MATKNGRPTGWIGKRGDQEWSPYGMDWEERRPRMVALRGRARFRILR